MMESREGRIAPWAFAGVMVMGLLLFVVWRFGQASSPAVALALKASRVDLVGQMQVALASAAEAEKSAVLAVTDQESLAFAERSRAASAEVERGRVELGRLSEAAGTAQERAMLAQLSQDLLALRALDDEVLRLAVKNTNLKASALAFGPAAATLDELDAALGRLESRRAGSPQAARVQRLADRVRLGALRIQVLLAPHIAAEQDEVMSRLEAVMSGHAQQVRVALDGLSALAGAPDAAPVAASFARYLELEAQVLALSRENTNVRSLALSLGKKRAAQAVCQDALNALQQAILEEPIAGITYGRPNPTR
jgi:hypothetical protein